MTHILAICGIAIWIIAIVIFVREYLRQVNQKKYTNQKDTKASNGDKVSNESYDIIKGIDSLKSGTSLTGNRCEESDEEDDEKWHDVSCSSSSSSSTPERTAKMQFLVLNKGSNQCPKLAPNVIAGDVAVLAVANIVLVRGMVSDEIAEPQRSWNEAYNIWCSNGVTKITLRVDKRSDFDDLVRRVQTGGRDGTPLMPMSVKDYDDNRCLAAIGPFFSEELVELTGHLKLLS
eukprot:Tbor_TRINITY_DN1975_c0_g1::TRINITY_DN1975_c0_g1_i1::g.3529::m.3529